MSKLSRVASVTGVTAVTATGWWLMVEFLAASQHTFQKGQQAAIGTFSKLGTLVERCQPKEWYNTVYGCGVPGELSGKAGRLTMGEGPAPVSAQIHDFLASRLPEGLVNPVARTMQDLVQHMYGRGVADIAVKADLVRLNDILGQRCGRFVNEAGTVCGTTSDAITPLLKQMTTSGATTPKELLCYLLAGAITIVVGAAVTARATARRPAKAPAAVLAPHAGAAQPMAA